MPNRFRRRRSHRLSDSRPGEGMSPTRRRRIIRTLFWLGAALLLLAAVLGYDRTAVQEAQQHVEQAKSYAARGMYDEAILSYQHAFDNTRLSRARKAEIAVAIGDIEFERFRDYGAAFGWYQRAKRIYPRETEKPLVKQRLEEASRLSKSGVYGRRGADGAGGGPYDVTMVQLVARPAEDTSGPVVASFKGGAVHAGQLARALRDLPLETVIQLQNNETRMGEFVRQELARELLYRAAVDAGYDRNPDISARLYDYQRTLISERYAAERRQQAQVVPNQKVEEFYRAHQEQYVQPGQVGLAMIKTASQADAEAARRQLVARVPFGDVATSYSTDQASARTQGVVGVVRDTDTSIPGVGVEPELVKNLMKLSSGAVTSPTLVSDSWYIFKVLSNTPRRLTSLEEARPKIEAALRAEQGSSAAQNLSENLFKRYEAQIRGDQLKQFWNYVHGQRQTTATLSTTPDTTATREAEGGGV